MKNPYIFYPIIFLFTAGVFVLQIFLSKRNVKRWGLFLPTANFLLSLLYILSNSFASNDGNNMKIVSITQTLLLSNVPTIVLIVIYLYYIEKLKREEDKEIMDVQDRDEDMNIE